MLKLSKPQSSHEELFMQRYERLRSWALHLVLGDQQQAEDLLHDAFIHFTLHKTLIEHVQNLDAYLNTMLRNLHLSQARRLARTPLGHLSLLDYDSADIGLQSIDPRDQIKVQDELRMICRYSCIRKQTSKAGSVLILRFFHGYYPAEIARILNCLAPR
jgi:RNA polymerase sigma factor (sigma-70 family)